MLKTTQTHAKFPLIEQLKQLGIVYLDSAATAQKPLSVIDCADQALREQNFPAQRSLYPQATAISAQIEQIRQQILLHFSAKQSHQVIFCASATDGLNLLANSLESIFALQRMSILLTNAEHVSNLAPWLKVANKKSLPVDIVKLPTRGFFRYQDFQPYLQDKPQLLAVTVDSNLLGPVWEPGLLELQQLITQIHRHGGLVILDATQAIAFQRLDLSQLNADFLIFSGHKFGAAHGIGVVVGRNRLIAQLDPWRVGGGNVHLNEQLQFLTPNGPERLEAGSLPIAAILTLKPAFEAVASFLLPHRPQVNSLCQLVVTKLSHIKDIDILGNSEFIQAHGHMVSFNHRLIPAHDLAWQLGQKNILVRAGTHCAPLLHQQFGLNASVRISLFAYNQAEDVTQFITALKQSINFFLEQLHE